MPQIEMDSVREIITDFAKVIFERKIRGPQPAEAVINFRQEQIHNVTRPVYFVPTNLLRLRKDNGRILSDVLSYQRENLKELNESDDVTQKILFDFLYNKDRDSTDTLINSIRKEGQIDPAIITADGFLINGNRRKMALEQLQREDPTKYKDMKVVILPLKGEEGGPPTLKEIEFIENRYQLQQDGKSEYKGLDRALSILRKIRCGITLEEQLKDDPDNSELKVDSPRFLKAVEKSKKDYLYPLKCVDKYLKQIDREECYDLVEDRWQAFIDYSILYNGKLHDKGWLAKANISESEIGRIEDVAFKIIRKKSIEAHKAKLHQIMRDLPKLLINNDSKKSLFGINTAVKDLEEEDKVVSLDAKDYDRAWSQKNGGALNKFVALAYSHKNIQQENESAINLLRGAYSKLTHSNMRVDLIPKNDLSTFRTEIEALIDTANDLKSEAQAKQEI